MSQPKINNLYRKLGLKCAIAVNGSDNDEAPIKIQRLYQRDIDAIAHMYVGKTAEEISQDPAIRGKAMRVVWQVGSSIWSDSAFRSGLFSACEDGTNELYEDNLYWQDDAHLHL